MSYLIAVAVFLLIVAGLFVLNVWDRRYMASLSAEERAEVEEETRRELQLW